MPQDFPSYGDDLSKQRRSEEEIIEAMENLIKRKDQIIRGKDDVIKAKDEMLKFKDELIAKTQQEAEVKNELI